MHFLFLQALVELTRQHKFLRRKDLSGLHTRVRETPVSDRASGLEDTAEICGAVAKACIWYPTQVFCLQRSAAATILLRRYGIAAEMIIGAQRMPLRAHAWVEVNGQVVNDKPAVRSDYLVMERC